MCTELPVELTEVRPDGTARGWVGGRTAGRPTDVSLVMLDGPAESGDWVVAHAGFALHRISAAAAQDALIIHGAATSGAFPSGTLAGVLRGQHAADALPNRRRQTADGPAPSSTSGSPRPAVRSTRKEPT